MLTIKTKSGEVYQRIAWTGGDTPPDFAKNSKKFRELRSAFFREYLGLCARLDLWKFTDEKLCQSDFDREHFKKHGYFGTGCIERARILWNAANLDAWRTIENSVNERLNAISLLFYPIDEIFSWFPSLAEKHAVYNYLRAYGWNILYSECVK